MYDNWGDADLYARFCGSPSRGPESAYHERPFRAGEVPSHITSGRFVHNFSAKTTCGGGEAEITCNPRRNCDPRIPGGMPSRRGPAQINVYRAPSRDLETTERGYLLWRTSANRPCGVLCVVRHPTRGGPRSCRRPTPPRLPRLQNRHKWPSPARCLTPRNQA
jgi:hypothetical protein